LSIAILAEHAKTRMAESDFHQNVEGGYRRSRQAGEQVHTQLDFIGKKDLDTASLRQVIKDGLR